MLADALKVNQSLQNLRSVVRRVLCHVIICCTAIEPSIKFEA